MTLTVGLAWVGCPNTGWVQGLRAAAGSSDAVLASNQHDCKAEACTIIETDYYMYEALRRLEGHFPPETMQYIASTR